MNSSVELAAQFIHRGDIVLANDVLRDECGVEYGYPAQVQYYEFHYTGQSIIKALKNLSEMFGCLTSIMCEGASTWLTVVGEKDSVDALQKAQRLAVSGEYGYKELLKKRASDAGLRSLEEYEKWTSDYILGFFEGLAGNPEVEHLSRFSKHPRVLGILDGFDSMERYERLEAK